MMGQLTAVLSANAFNARVFPAANLVLWRGDWLFSYCRSRGPRRSWGPHGSHGRPWRRQRWLSPKRAPGFPGEPIRRRKRPAPSWRLAVPQSVCTSLDKLTVFTSEVTSYPFPLWRGGPLDGFCLGGFVMRTQIALWWMGGLLKEVMVPVDSWGPRVCGFADIFWIIPQSFGCLAA